MPAPRSRLLWFALAAVVAFLAATRLDRRHAPSSRASRISEPAQAATAPASNNVATPAPVDLPSADDAPATPNLLTESTAAWLESRFPDSEVLEQQTTPPDSEGRFKRTILLRTQFKYPLVEIDEDLSQTKGATTPVVQRREALVADHFLVAPRTVESAAALEATVTQAGGWIDHALLAESGVKVVHLSQPDLGSVKAAVAALNNQPQGPALYAEPDYLCFTTAIPNDPYFPAELGLHDRSAHTGDIDAEAGWNIATSAANVVVAVIDTGVRYTHRDLRANMWHNPGELTGNGIDDDYDGWTDDIYGVNFVANTVDPDDDNGHGTHVAGILGARGNDGVGIAGVAWRVQIMALKFLNTWGVGATSDAVRAVNYAVANGAQVMNISWASYSYSQTFGNAISSANNAGIPLICAAGDDEVDTDEDPTYPACYKLPNVISVGGLSDDKVADYSNFGAKSVDLFAPGTNILSLSNANDTAYMRLSGSSMAAPFVTGIMALLRAQYPRANIEWLRARILNTAAPTYSLAGLCASGGRADLFRCLAEIYPPRIRIANAPIAATGDIGTPAYLRVDIIGSGTLFFQWYHDGKKLAGQTSDTLSLSSLTAADAGEYYVVVHNLTSSVKSKPVSITVTASPPILDNSSADIAVLANQYAGFYASFHGALPMTFQWECNEVAIDGATGSGFEIFNATPAQEGDYRVRATNAYGSAYSSAAHLSVVSSYLQQWTAIQPGPANVNYNKVAYLNGQFVAVGDKGTICVSPDCANWRRALGDKFFNLHSVAFGAGHYVAVGDFGGGLTSSDAINWTQLPQLWGSAVDITYGNGKFLVAADGSAILSSEDGMQWTIETYHLDPTYTYTVNAIAYGNSRYMVVGSANSNAAPILIWVSTDGANWTSANAPPTIQQPTVSFCYADGYFWLCDGSTVFQSIDGASWTNVRTLSSTACILPVSKNLYTIEQGGAKIREWPLDSQGAVLSYSPTSALSWTSLASGAGHVVAVGKAGALIISDNDCDFRDIDRFTENTLEGAAFGNGKFLILDETGAIYASTDGAHWPLLSAVPDYRNTETSMAFGNGVFAVSDGVSNVWTSTDGTIWAAHSMHPLYSSHFKINFAGGYFWLHSDTPGGDARSADGVNWTPTGGAADVYGNSQWLGFTPSSGSYGTFSASGDGVTWRDIQTPSGAWEAACYANGLFYGFDDSYRLLTAGPDLKWTAQLTQGLSPYSGYLQYPDAFIHQLVFQDGVFVASTWYGISISLDGIHWDRASAFADVPQLVQAPGMALAITGGTVQVAGHLSLDRVTLPNVVTLPATDISVRGATLSGTVNSGNAPTTVIFEYGPTPALGKKLAAVYGDGGDDDEKLSAFVSLAPLETCYFRVTASNASGAAVGETRSFGTSHDIPPNAVDDGPYFIRSQGPNVLDVLANDHDVDQDPLTVIAVAQPMHGTVAFTSLAVTYTPDAEYFGQDAFRYTISDPYGGISTATVTLQDVAQRVSAPSRLATVHSGIPAPGAGQGGGPPVGTIVTGFGPPALNDARAMAATVKLGSGSSAAHGILVIDQFGALHLPAFTGAPAPGLAPAVFTQIANPVLNQSGVVAFIGQAQSGAAKSSAIEGIWSNAFTPDGSLALLLKTGLLPAALEIPAGETLQSLSTVLLSDSPDAAYALGRLAPSGAAILLRIDDSGPQVVVREKGPLPDGSTVTKLDIFQPASGSTGEGRWSGDGSVTARVTLSDGTISLLEITNDATKRAWNAFSTKIGKAPSTHFGLPAVCGDALAFAAYGLEGRKLTVVENGVDLELAHVGMSAAYSGGYFAAFEDPLINENWVAFLATLNGKGITDANGEGVWVGHYAREFDPQEKLAQLGDLAPDESGAAASKRLGPFWSRFISLALPGGNAGPILVDEVRGPGITAANNQGIWALDSTGIFRQILRTGPSNISGETATITRFEALGADSGAVGVARSYNSTGSLAVKAVFADGSQALLRLDVP